MVGRFVYNRTTSFLRTLLFAIIQTSLLAKATSQEKVLCDAPRERGTPSASLSCVALSLLRACCCRGKQKANNAIFLFAVFTAHFFFAENRKEKCFCLLTPRALFFPPAPPFVFFLREQHCVAMVQKKRGRI